MSAFHQQATVGFRPLTDIRSVRFRRVRQNGIDPLPIVIPTAPCWAGDGPDAAGDGKALGRRTLFV